MGRLVRFSVPASVAILGSAVLGLQVALAQPPPGPPGFLPAGEYFSSSSSAHFRGTTSSGLSVNAFINRVTTVNQPKDAPQTTGTETILTLSASGFNPSTGVFIFETGCFQIPSSDLTVASDLSMATLIVSIDTMTPTCGPGGFGLPPSFSVSLTWTGTGPVASNHGVSQFECIAYKRITQRNDTDNLATVSGTVTAIPDPITAAPGALRVGTIDHHVSGMIDPTCPPGGGAKGAGPGPQAAGNYQFTSIRDGAIFQSPDFTRFFNVFVTRNVEVANPLSGSSFTTDTLQVHVSINDFSTFPPVFLNGCFTVLSPGALTQKGVQSAHLHVQLLNDPAQTPPCSNQFGPPNNIPLPLTVDATWTIVGASESNRDTSQFSCATFATESTGTNSGAAASDSFTLPELFPGQTFGSASQGGLTTSELTIHEQGVDPQNCIVRG